MRNVYVIYGIGRTGSHFIQDILAHGNKLGGLTNSRSFHYPIHLNEIKNCNENIVIHSHQKDVFDNINVPHEQITAILSKRHNEFDRIMSYFVAKNSDEWVDYSNNFNKKFEIPLINFYQYIKKINNKEFYNLNYNLKEKIEIYYEDLEINGILHIANKLNISYNEKIHKCIVRPKSPYHYKNHITNWNQLYNFYKFYTEKFNI
jgi:hypothetical protein